MRLGGSDLERLFTRVFEQIRVECNVAPSSTEGSNNSPRYEWYYVPSLAAKQSISMPGAKVG